MIVYAIVAGIDITQYASNKVCYYDVHTLYIIHSTFSRVNSVIFQYCWWILSNECSKWLAPSFSKSTFTLDLECIAICLMLMSIGVFSKLALVTNNWIMDMAYVLLHLIVILFRPNLTITSRSMRTLCVYFSYHDQFYFHWYIIRLLHCQWNNW